MARRYQGYSRNQAFEEGHSDRGDIIAQVIPIKRPPR